VIRRRPIIGLRITDDDRPEYHLFIRTEEVVPGAEPRSLGNERIQVLDEWSAKHLHLQLSNALAFRDGIPPSHRVKLEDKAGQVEEPEELLSYILKNYVLIPKEDMPHA
jgi:hypothetical protein